jgi:hypothetical protein
MREKEEKKKCVHFEMKYHSPSCCIFSLHTSTLVEKNVATSRENLISNNKGEIKKNYSIRQMVLFDFYIFLLMIHWSSYSCLKLF